MPSEIEPIVVYLRRRLKAVGRPLFPVIAAETGVALSFLHKFTCAPGRSERDNPRVLTVQPLLTYFGQVDRGERELPVKKSA